MPDAPQSQRLLLLDAATLYFRAFYGIPSSVTAPDGTPSGAVRGFLDMTATLVDRFRPAAVVACWDDDWRPAWRVARIGSYKAHRVASEGPAAGGAHQEEVPEHLPAQVDGIVELLAALGVPRTGAPACEADDVAGVLATRPGASRTGGTVGVDVVSGDRDLLQLVDDDAHGGAGVRVVWIGKGVGGAEVVDGAALAERYALPAQRPGDAYADLAVLRGDPSDGLPGVAGIGEKTAAGLLRRHGDLAGVLQAALDGAASPDPLTPSQRRRLAEAADYLDVAPRVVRVLRDGEVVEPFGGDERGARAEDVPRLDLSPASGRVDEAAVAALAERWGARSPAERLVAALTR